MLKVIFALAFNVIFSKTFNLAFGSELDNVANKLTSGITKIQYSLHTSDNHLTMDCLKICHDFDTVLFGIFHAVNSVTHFSELFYTQFDNTTGQWKNTVKLSDRGSQGTVTRIYNKGLPVGPDGSHDFPGTGYVFLRPLRDFVDKGGKWIGGCYQNYDDWSGLTDNITQGVLRQAGCLGKIGQRDFFYIATQKYYLYECNINPAFGWYSWRIALYSPTLKQAKLLGLVLGGDIDIANPHISLASKSGGNYEFTLTFFLPGQGINPDKQAKGGQSVVTTKFLYP